MGHFSSDFVLVLGDFTTGHTESSHAGLGGEPVRAHLEVDEALGVTVLVVGFSD